MLAKYLLFVLLVTVVVAEIPPYIKICGRKNPNLNKCVTDSVNGLREKLRVGMPEVDAPPLEPLILVKGFPVSQTETLKAYATNVKLFGLSNFDIKSVQVDLEGKSLDLDLIFKQVNLDADYDVTAKILVPIVGKGPIHITTDNVHARAVLKYKLVKRKGSEYMFFPTMTLKLDLNNFKADFKPVDDGPDRTVASAINAALEGGQEEILQSIKPTLERVISEEVLRICNKICQHFKFADLFPEHE